MATKTDDPTKRYSDSDLDPSRSAFDEIVNQPDMQAFGDQTEAFARDQEAKKLKRAEARADRTQETEGQSIKEAESKPSDNGLYNPDDKKPTRVSGTTNRKTNIKAAVAIVTIVVAFLSFGMLLPLKIPGIMQMIADEAGQRVEQITEKRAKLMIGRYMLNKALPNRFVITGEGAVASLMASMRTARFEKKLEAKGITFDGSGDGVKIRINGELLEGGRTLKSDVEIIRALDGKPASRKIINDIVKEEIPSWRWMKRAKFAKWLRLKYNIPRYGLENSNNPDEEERIKEMQENRLRPEYNALASDIGSATECIMGTDCDVDTQGDGRPSDMPTSGDSSSIGNDAEEAIDETIDASTEAGQGVQKTLIKTVIDKLATKAIPIVGWIDLVATIDHIAWDAVENDYFGKVAAYYRAQQYARHYGVWSGYGSQIQLGAMDPEFIRILAEQTEGIEEAQAFNYIQGDASKGEPVDKINSNSTSSFGKDLQEINSALGGDGMGREVVHHILNAYYETIGGGGLLGWVSSKLGDFFAAVSKWIAPEFFEEWFGKLVQKIGEKLFEIMGLDFDPLIKGADWMNAAHGGATWTYNDYCKNEMGCRKLTPEQTALQNSAIAAERAQYTQEKGLAYALFSTETSHSLLSQMAIAAPTNISSATTKLGKFVANIPATALSIFTKKTSASAYVDIHGVDPYGALSDELNAPIDQTAIEGGDCGESFDGEELNLCQTDTVVAEAMICEFKPDEGECAENALDSSSLAEIEFTVGSYNQKRALSESEHMKAVNNIVNRGMDVVGTQETSEPKFSRYKRALADKNYGAFPEHMGPNQTCAGAQAIFYNKSKFTFVKGEWFDAPRYPDPAVNCGSGEKTTPGHNNGDARLPSVWTHIPIVWLQETTTGREIIVMNTHNVANVAGAAGTRPSYSRLVANKIYIEQIERLQAENPGTPIVFTGDFNEGTGVRDSRNVTWQGDVNNLLFCMFAKNNLMYSAGGPNMKCGGYGIGGVDYIYVTPEVVVESFHELSRAEAASDHPAIYAKLKVPGTGVGTLKIASFNILHVGDSDFEKQWRTRLPTSINLLKENGIAVAGLQEVRPQQHKLLKSESYSTDTYDIFPQVSEGRGFTPNPVIWNKSMFKLVKGRTLPIEYDNGHNINHGVLVKLEDSSGNQFYVLNTHDPANVRPPEDDTVNEKSRLDNANFYVNTLSNLNNEGLPLFLTGDFNNGYTMGGNQQPYENKASNLTYCVVSRSGFMKNVWDIFENKQFECPRSKVPGNPPAPIDHIYAGNVDGVKKAWTAPDRSNGSDHPTMMAEVDMPWVVEGNGDQSSTGWVWPLRSNINNGPCYGGTSGHAGMDMNSSTTDNPVLAMHTGTVETVGTDSLAGNYVTIKASVKFRGKPVYYSYEHLKTGSIPSGIKRNARVNSGQKIGIAGTSGRVSLGSSKAHLHIVTATTNTLGAYGRLGTTFNPMDILGGVKPVPGGYRCDPT